jgi:hypothetical protein
LSTGRLDAGTGPALVPTARPLKSNIEVRSPIGSNANVPLKPIVDTRAPATIGPKKNPAFPPERKIASELPLDVALDFATVEKAGG